VAVTGLGILLSPDAGRGLNSPLLYAISTRFIVRQLQARAVLQVLRKEYKDLFKEAL